MPACVFNPRSGWVMRCVVLLMMLGAMQACDDLSSGTSGTNAGATPGTDAVDPDAPTIVSLTPAVTQMLIDMGKRSQLVGVSRDDDASLGLAVCGTYRDPIVAKILELKPDLVVTESSLRDQSDVPGTLVSLAEQGVFDLAVIPHSRSIADVERALVDAEQGLGPAVGDAAAAEDARALMALRLELIKAVVKDAKAPRVLMLINPTTLGTIGTGVTHDELLTLAGATNAAESYNTGYLKLTRAQILQAVRPDVVLIFEPGGRPLVDGDARLAALQGLSVPAVTNQRIVVINHPQAMLPSTALPAVLVQIASAVHPDRADAIRMAYDLAEPVRAKSDAPDGASR